MRLRHAGPALAPVILFSLPHVAGAQSSGPNRWLTYIAPDACPSQQDFVQRVRSRTHVAGGRDAREPALRVQIVVVDGRFVGRLSLLEEDRRSTTKTLTGRDCDELVDALSLVAALAIDSNEKAVSSDAEPRPPPPPPLPAPPRAPAPARTPEPARQSAPANGFSSRLGVGLGGVAAWGPAPSVLFGGEVNLDWVFAGESPFAPAFGLDVALSQSLDADARGGTASFTWFSVRADACLLRLHLGPTLRLRGCLLGDFGQLRASGSRTFLPATSSRGWLSLGGSSGLEVPLGGRLALNAVVGVEAPLRRDRYAFAAHEFFVMPAAVSTIALSFMAYFP